VQIVEHQGFIDRAKSTMAARSSLEAWQLPGMVFECAKIPFGILVKLYFVITTTVIWAFHLPRMSKSREHDPASPHATDLCSAPNKHFGNMIGCSKHDILSTIRGRLRLTAGQTNKQ